MKPTSSGSAAPASRPREQRWQRRHNGYALAVAVVIHVGLLVAVLSWRSKAPPPKPRSSDVSIVLTQPPEPREPPPPAPKLTEPPPPNVPLMPELPPVTEPKVEPVPQAVAPLVAPPIAAAAPAAPPAPAPVVAAAPPPAASAAVPPKLFEECAEAADRPMVAEVYRLRAGTTSVAEIRRRKPIKTVCLAQLDITPRDFRDGFPGLDMTEWFGLNIRFTVNMPQDLTMDLMLLSDDGATLSVDDVDVINNDGVHAATPLMATVNLAKGLRHFRVRYFQGPGYGLALMLAWKKPEGKDYQYIPRQLLGRPAAAPAPG